MMHLEPRSAVFCNDDLTYPRVSVRQTILKWSLRRIGLGIALKYLSEGHDVLLVGRSLDRLKGAIPADFEGTGRSLFLAKDVSTVCAAQNLSCLRRMTRAAVLLS